MKGSVVIAVRVSMGERAALLALADREQTTVAGLIRCVIERVVHPLASRDDIVQSAPKYRLRSERFTLRLATQDAALLAARAEARGLRAATYASTLLRAHLRSIAPLPVDEVRTLKRLISELSAIGRNLNQIARSTNQGQAARLTREDLMALLGVCEGLRKETKALLRANVLSWEIGNATPDG